MTSRLTAYGRMWSLRSNGHPRQFARTTIGTPRRWEDTDGLQHISHVGIAHLMAVLIPGIELVGLDTHLLLKTFLQVQSDLLRLPWNGGRLVSLFLGQFNGTILTQV